MSVASPLKPSDLAVSEFAAALDRYRTDHPGADVAVYRHGKYSVRVRVIDPAFTKLGQTERHRMVWPYFDPIDEEPLNDLTQLLMLAPSEVATSTGNLEFTNPSDPFPF